MPIQRNFARRLLPVLEELVAGYGTPFHIYDAEAIAATHRHMTAAFAGVPFKQYFAVKALPNPHILSLLLREGSGLDCSSPAELQLAERVGAKGEDIVFTSNNTTLDEYRQALDLSALVTFDDRSMLAKIDAMPPVVAFRVSPQGRAAGSALMGDTSSSKFGVPADELTACYTQAKERGASRFGIHGMTCANELDPSRVIRAAEDLFEIARHTEAAAGIRFEYVNIGGGLGIPYRPDDEEFDFARLAAGVIAARDARFGREPPAILMECGRYVTGPHGVLVARVVNRCRKARDVVGLDASMSALMRPGFYRTAYHHITLPFAKARNEVVVDVVGSLCENIDKFAVDRALPDPAEGDIVLVHDTGAHGHAMGFTYNGRLRPAELLLTADGSVVEIRRAETFDDYVATVRPDPRTVLAGEETSVVRRAGTSKAG
jgi:diaminopimelate decarboxylase/decarboxylase